MNPTVLRCMAVLVTLTSPAATSSVQAQQNGEATATVPTVVKTDYDMHTFVAAPNLSETELNGRRLVGQRCANCHGGTTRNPGPLLGRQTVDRLGESAIREKIAKGSLTMPGFEYSLESNQIDQIIAFLKTYAPARNSAPAQEQTQP